MVDFVKARQQAINELQKVETLAVLSEAEIVKLGYKSGDFFIRIDTEYMGVDDIVKPIIFHMKLPAHFPLEMPKVYLPASELTKFKFLPHVENDGQVCTFDTNITRTNPNEPAQILKVCLRRAKSILTSGVRGDNDADYEDEFKSYWAKSYNDTDKVEINLLCITDEKPIPNKLKLVKVNNKNTIFKYILHQDEEYALRFLNYLNQRKITYEEQPVLYIGEIGLKMKPPFALTNLDVIRIVQKLSPEIGKNYSQFINNSGEPKMIVATVMTSGSPQIIAWKHSPININKKVNGFRKGKLKNYQRLSIFQSREFVRRYQPMILSPRQKELRTSGKELGDTSYIFTVAGVGSIGSNLIYFLNSFINVHFKLIDFDLLKPENIGRHFLGYYYVFDYKTIVMKHYLENKNPFQHVEVKNQSIIDVYVQDEGFMNSSDYIFLTTGNTNVEEYMVNLLQEGKIIKPMFLIWVEPYLVGGHCLYLHPNDANYDEYFFEDNFFKFNVIDNNEYREGNALLSIKEAGCLTTFTPYSQSSVTLFLAAIFPEIKNIITRQSTKSKAFSWIGDLDYVEKNNVRIKPEYKNLSSGKIVFHDV